MPACLPPTTAQRAMCPLASRWPKPCSPPITASLVRYSDRFPQVPTVVFTRRSTAMSLHSPRQTRRARAVVALCFALLLAAPAFGARAPQPRAVWPTLQAAAPWGAAAGLLVLGPLIYMHWVRRRTPRARYSSLASIRRLPYRELERLLSESLRLQGYSVEERGASESGNGACLVLRKPGQKIVVRYVHHAGAAVGLDAMGELHRIMSSEAATGGLIVTSGDVTPDAKAWTADKPIGLIEGRALLELVNRSRTQKPAYLHEMARREPHLGSTLAELLDCPLCGAPMVPQGGDQRSHSSARFFGCSVPRCPGTRPA